VIFQRRVILDQLKEFFLPIGVVNRSEFLDPLKTFVEAG
jgi:hypothetical protein